MTSGERWLSGRDDGRYNAPIKLIPPRPVHSIRLCDLFRWSGARGAHDERHADLYIHIHVHGRTQAAMIDSFF